MIRKVLTALGLCATVVLTGCGGSNTAQTSPSASVSVSETPSAEPENTVTINGKQWTCEQITASTPQACGEFTQQAFDTYKENIDTYVNSGKLGPLNNGNEFLYEDAAFAGLVACAIRIKKGDENEYIDTMMQTSPFDTKLTERAEYLPAWFEAPKSLCTDLSGFQSKDLKAP